MALIIDTDTAVANTSAWFLALNSMAVIEAGGEDSSRFLQGQLSCNLQKLNEENSIRGALCNLKGRVIANMRLLLDNETILLISRADLQEKILTTLNKYKVFFKTSLTATVTQYGVYGIGGVNLAAMLDRVGVSLPETTDSCTRLQGMTFVRMPMTSLLTVPRCLVIFNRSSEPADALWQKLQALLEQVPESTWTVADIRTGQAHPALSQSELFTPQLLNYDINGVIDFKKGCYTGQEIVARMFYRADAKRRLYYLHSTPVSGTAGGNTFSAHSDDVVISVSSEDGNSESLVILNCEQAKMMSNVFSFE